jgi:hypothetical protein
VRVHVERGANRVEIAKRRQDIERAREHAFPPKQLQQSPRAAIQDALDDPRRHDSTGVDQQLGAGRTGELLFTERVEAVAKRAGGDSQNAAFPVVALPGQQRRVFPQQLLQAFDVVVVNEASSLPDRPLQTAAKALADFSGEVLPAAVAVLTRECELSVAPSARPMR